MNKKELLKIVNEIINKQFNKKLINFVIKILQEIKKSK